MEKRNIPRIRHEFKAILRETAKAILFLGFDKKEYWVPKSSCTLIKEKKGKVIATLAVYKFEEITNIEVEPMTTNFSSLGGSIMDIHTAKWISIIESLTFPLLPKQKPIVNLALKSKFTAFLCEAGTGKTLMSLTVAYSRYKSGLINHIIILCPASLQNQWKELASSYYPDIKIDVYSIHSASYELSLNRIKKNFNQKKGKIQLIVDEVHLCRNQSAKRSRNIEKSFAADYTMILTAFPIERNAGDLYYQFGIMDRAILGMENYGQFQSKFLLLGGRDGDQVVAYQNTKELSDRISPYIVRLTKKEVVPELPEKLEYEIYFDMNQNQIKAYNAINALMNSYEWLPKNKSYQFSSFLQKLASGYSPTNTEIENIFGNLGKLGEGANNVARISNIGFDEGNNRLLAMMKLITEINEQAIIWCNYIDEMEAIHSKLPNSAVINGSVNLKERSKLINNFKTGKITYLIISVAINEGFNLQNCRNAIFYSDTYSRTKAKNAAERIHRIGQTEQCNIYKLIARKSLDERIKSVRQQKDKICNIFDENSYS